MKRKLCVGFICLISVCSLIIMANKAQAAAFKLKSSSMVLLDQGKTSRIRVVCKGKAKYRSSNKKIVRVSARGIITARRKGKARIAVSYKRKTLWIDVFVRGKKHKETGPYPPQLTKTVMKKVIGIKRPSSNKIIAKSFVITSNKKKYTLYFLNLAYKGQVSVTWNGYEVQKKGTVKSLLSRLVSDKIWAVNKAGTIECDHFSQPYWIINDSRKKQVVTCKLRAFTRDTFYYSPYGLIVTLEDTRNQITIR